MLNLWHPIIVDKCHIPDVDHGSSKTLRSKKRPGGTMSFNGLLRAMCDSNRPMPGAGTKSVNAGQYPLATVV